MIDAFLLAAGLGTRLRPLTNVVPKAALPLLDVPLGAVAAGMLAGRGGQLAVNVSHLRGEAVAQLSPWLPSGTEILVEAPEPYGTAGTLVALRPRLADTFLTWNADQLMDLDPAALLATHRRRGALVTLATRLVDGGADFEASGDRLVRLIDRRLEPQRGGHLFIGAAAFERAALERLPEVRPLGLTEALLAPLALEGAVAMHVHSGYALDVGTPARYLRASLDLLAGRGPALPHREDQATSGPGAPHRTDRAASTGGELPGQVVDVEGGTAYLGPGAEVVEGAAGPGAVILSGATVEGRVQESIVWPGATVPSDARVKRAIWFSNQAIAATPP